MKNFVYILLVALGLKSFGQTGPGGVGDNSSNVLWIKADNLSGLNNYDKISNWEDASGNGNDLTQSNAVYQPSYISNGANGNPVVRFDQSNGRLRKTNFSDFPTTEITTFIVDKNEESNDAVFSYASSNYDNELLIFNSSSLEIYRGDKIEYTGISINDNNWHILDLSWKKSGGKMEFWLDGNMAYSAGSFASGKSMKNNGSLAIGAEQDGIDASYEVSQDHQGDYAEVIVFNTILNEAERIIVANYLGAKYGISIGNDYYAFESTHSADLAGIGKTSGSNTNISAQSAGILKIQNASSVGNNEYLLFAHNKGQINTWNTSNTPDGGNNIKSLERVWKLDETGDVGNVDFRFTTSSLPALESGFTMYGLMIDADGDFTSGASVYELTHSGGEYIRQGVDINDGDYVTIVCLRPTVQHTLAASSGFEPNNASMQVQLNFIPNSTYSVKYSTSNGTATAPGDYTSVSNSTLSFSAGISTKSFNITIKNDVNVENSENFYITLSSPSGILNLGTNVTHTYTINDDDAPRKIYFTQSSSNGNESVNNPSISVQINNTDAVNPTTVDYAVTGGTATSGGEDYVLNSGTLTIPAGASSGTIQLNITHDDLYELDETIVVTLSNPTNSNLDGVAPYGGTGILEHTYTIVNDDSKPTIQFSLSSSTLVEDAGSLNVAIALNTIGGAPVSATYTVTNISATNGSDYSLASGTVNIPAGSTTANLNIGILEDNNEESNETFSITLSSPVNASLGVNTVHTVTITDNDGFGYQGPGGVGNQNTNILWLKGETLSALSNGDNITNWADASGNGNDFSQNNTSYTPRYYSEVINGHPAIRFEQSDNRLVKENFDAFSGEEVTVFVVNKNSDSNDALISYASSAHQNDYLLFESSNMAIYRGAPSLSTGTSVNNNSWNILSTTWNSSNGATYLYKNGSQQYAGTLATGTSITGGGAMAIGGEQDGINSGYDLTQAHNGDFAEVIIYNTVLNIAKRKIVENYLAAKYGISIGTDLYAYDSGDSYSYEVSGIGRENSSNFHTDAKGSSILRINNASDLGDGEYLFWGHDGVDLVNGTRLISWSGMPAGVDNALGRVWRVDETGDVGTVSITVDLSAFSIGSSNDLVLLIDSDDGDFINATQIPITSYEASRNTRAVTSMATFNNVNFSPGDRFTIGSLSPMNALPIELTSFNVTQKEEHVSINWTTATETNNDFFTIEKSLDKENWMVVKEVNGAGTSFTTINYSSTDETPFEGTSYYRLKQTDFDGAFSYSDIKSVIFKAARREYQVYPVPARDFVTIASIDSENFELVVYDINGRKLNIPINPSVQKTIIDTQSLQNGIYFISIKDSFGIQTKKINIKH